MIEHLDQHDDEVAIATLKARLQSAGIADAELVSAELGAHCIQATDRAFGATVTMNLLGELTDIALPPLYTDHYEDAWDRAAQSISATAAALQARARSIAMRAIPLPNSQNGAADAR